MDLIKDSPKKKQPKISYFLRCYGFSINQEKLSSDKVKRKQSSCFSFKIFQRKQSPTKTVPIDTATAAVKVGAEKLNTSGDIHVVKLEKKVSVKRQQLPTATTVNVPDQVPVTGQTIHFNRFNKTKYDKHQDIILGNSKKLDDLQHSSYQNGLIRSFTVTNSDNASNLVIGSPQDKHEISRTVSLTPQKLNKQPTPTPTNRDKVDEGKDTTFNKGHFDYVIGMSILMVTLIIMLFWGKFCAIVCTSAWFYFLPRFRAKHELVINGGNLDVNSKEYKKKVVLNGFLERNHRNYVGS
ncbi:PREDICTED: uncharacterized protein LOC109240412 [Nicotiana attenuata]|uniref:Uncharacterized protein n=1 Tax=Nicotiana attenuata TaxID=49451 RepID=A0A314L829_NICAT|nr:PREDICTED: uncharacterized protein LOC109240412 [Nicotiana attenuata]OIT37695.1 uncharacterized protein A4A49_11601 [Nicotiana attenuata]